ncbi:Alpha-L-arabinofuranosidase B (ABFB) [Clavibacter michiganensis]|uniref:Alpha-L-arabinofuranosidase B (ABFB) n=1 Tax=Clavibacter michiganensis TaxID=28447 RepID=A0A251XUK9_9MICO|nr:Alpha-L-arabinofuranosidase B (ABFB) [Clavibacter michiganensis]
MPSPTLSRRDLHRLLGVGAAAALLPAAIAPSSAVAAPGDAYVMGYFTESPDGLGNDYGLHLAVSTDGLEWSPLNQNAPVVTPTEGTRGLRDPFLLRKQDGTFVVLATDLAGTDFAQDNQYIHVWDSTDLRSFSGYRRLRLHDLPTHSWAPEAFWDPARNQYGIIYSAYDGTQDVILVNYTSDFRTTSAPQTWFDGGAAVIDATVRVEGSTPYLYYKRDNRLFGAKGSLAPRGFENGTYTVGYDGAGLTEAPIVVRSATSATWYLWGDVYTPVNGVFTVWSSPDISRDAWTPLSRRAYTQPINSKHATIQPITATEHANLIAAWGLPVWNRVKSFNYPDRFIRHQAFRARIDPYPFDPFTDSQFVLAPGLGNAAGVSFRSLSDPVLYLRHSGFRLVLARDDGSALFAADATFTKKPGLADPSWTTFASQNFPDRVIRHRGSSSSSNPSSRPPRRRTERTRRGASPADGDAGPTIRRSGEGARSTLAGSSAGPGASPRASEVRDPSTARRGRTHTSSTAGETVPDIDRG